MQLERFDQNTLTVEGRTRPSVSPVGPGKSKAPFSGLNKSCVHFKTHFKLQSAGSCGSGGWGRTTNVWGGNVWADSAAYGASLLRYLRISCSFHRRGEWLPGTISQELLADEDCDVAFNSRSRKPPDPREPSCFPSYLFCGLWFVRSFARSACRSCSRRSLRSLRGKLGYVVLPPNPDARIASFSSLFRYLRISHFLNCSWYVRRLVQRQQRGAKPDSTIGFLELEREAEVVYSDQQCRLPYLAWKPCSSFIISMTAGRGRSSVT